MNTGRGRAALSALLPGFLCVLYLFPACGTAFAAGNGTVLEGSGIHYPEGFDPNTVGEVRGTARGVERPERGPIRFRLESGKEAYTVLVSPSWYWEDLRTEIREGAEVSVRGSKTLGRDMGMYIIAQEIRVMSSGQAWVFRDQAGFPLWKSQGGGMGAGGRSGSPMLRGGGGKGPGGMGGRGR
ncbi:MAG: hypothetical protein ACXWWT_13340 [Candidatus Deferrimicrobiaceae bacterium]